MAEDPVKAKRGRPKGARNKATASVKAAAQKHTEAAIATLAAIMNDKTEGAPARVAAAREILDRGHGKAPVSIMGAEDGPAIETVVRFGGRLRRGE
jgi:hypothetical protein